MIKILSIDFDYFIDVTEKERDTMFPQGVDEMPSDELHEVWEKKREEHPEIDRIRTHLDINIMGKYLRDSSKGSSIVVADSHKEIKGILDSIPKEVNTDIVNIDFHHDYYHYFAKGEEYNCGNWLRRFKEKRPNTKIRWVRREDSQVESLEGRFPFSSTTNICSVLHEEYDYIFLCFSPEWTPPHLERAFDDLLDCIKGEIKYANR